ncbi:MAG: hypothetical protein ACREA4_08035 [Nitrososphaera sp.]
MPHNRLRGQLQVGPTDPWTLFMEGMIKRGVIAPSFVASYSHSEQDIVTVAASAEVLRIYRRALDHGAEGYLAGRPVKPVFRRYA